MQIKETVKVILNKLPYVKGLYQQNKANRVNSFFPAGNFYSPVISLEDIKARESDIWKDEKVDLQGIDLQTEQQLVLLKQFTSYYADMPFKEEKQKGLRYYFKNNWYTHTDGIILYSAIRHYNPKRIIEIGSGFSSAVMLDVNGLFFDNKIDLTFIDPNPERLYSIMSKADKTGATVLVKEIQQVPVDVFKDLRAGDILFVDSSHVVKTASDVNYVLFEILPVLQPGVVIHFHDIFYPFEYPKKWVFAGYSWNEAYFLKAFLMYNDQFDIIFFSDYIHKYYKDAFKDMPLSYGDTGANLWLKKN